MEEELVRLHGVVPAEHAASEWDFAPGQIRDPQRLARRLKELAEITLDVRLAAAELRALLSAELNRLLGVPRLPDSRRFSWSLVPSPRRMRALRELGREALEERELRKLNRLFLEEIFPDEIAKAADARLASVHQRIHSLDRPRTALCLSGGGLRSAAFTLGAVQGLARSGMLGSFDYLSTVSGGGYLGGLLTAWAHRHREGMAGVAGELSELRSGASLDPEPKPLRYLRTHSSYLSPQLGALSADTWTLATIYLRNLYLHWLVCIPLLLAVLLVPRLYVSILQGARPWIYRGIEILPLGLFVLGSVAMSMAIAYIGWHRPSGGLARGAQRGFLRLCLLPLVISSLALTAFWAWAAELGSTYGVIHFILPSVGINLLGWGIHVLGLLQRGLLRPRKLWELPPLVFVGVVGGAVTHAAARNWFPEPLDDLPLYVLFAPPLLLLIFLGAETLFAGLVSRWTEEEDREWWARTGAWILIFAACWTVMTGAAIFGPVALLTLPQIFAPLGSLSGLLTLLLASSARTSESKGPNPKESFTNRLIERVVLVSAPIALLFCLALLSLLLDWFIGQLPHILSVLTVDAWEAGRWLGPRPPAGARVQELVSLLASPFEKPSGLESHFLSLAQDHLWEFFSSPLFAPPILLIMAVTLGLAVSLLVDINKFSLHAMFRNRLVRAFLGASHEGRRPNPFTGFDPRDNLEMHKLAGQRPLHVVNLALNLVGGENLAWQHRKAEPFTITPLHSGSLRVGYRSSSEYGRGETGRAITLGTALAISGAAASPNMGYHSSPVVTLLMTLFNARLGWWLGNPGPAGQKTFGHSHPRFGIRSLIAEGLGMTDEANRYVYLSDGGHFDNLGLYEMVLRRCRFILLCDASEDPEFRFEDLGNAVRKIRIDLGIPIEFDRVPISKSADSGTGRYCALGRILYHCVDGTVEDGVLLYIKPVVYGDEPRDILHYRDASPTFPHEPTADQWFTEAQFESYRMLGSHAVATICGTEWKGRTVADFVARCEEYLAPAS